MPTPPSTAPNRKVRDDDRRGAPRGPGHRGNVPFVPTDEQRAKVRALAQAITEYSNRYIAREMGISEDTLTRHFAEEMDSGRAALAAAAGAQLVSLALYGDDALDANGKKRAPGNLDALKFLLARRFGWSSKIEHTGRMGGPLEVIDLTNLNEEELEFYGRMSAKVAGIEPEPEGLLLGPPDA